MPWLGVYLEAKLGGLVGWIGKTKFCIYKIFNRRGLRFILAGVASLYASARTRRVCRVSHADNWVHEFPSGSLVEPQLTLRTLEQIEDFARDMWMYQHLPCNGEIVVDVGAGTGRETLLFSRQVGEYGRVISIEAHPRVFGCLSKMCLENRLENVTLVQAAIMDREGHAFISDGEDHDGHHIVNDGSEISVVATTLDQLFVVLKLSHVDLLKMNIEGAERYSLVGMREMIRRIKYVCISCHDFVADEGGSPEMRTKAEVIAFLKDNNFSIVLRESDPRPYVRACVYGLNLGITSEMRIHDQGSNSAMPAFANSNSR